MLRINKKHLLLILLVFFIFTHKASAGLEITDINYNPTVKTNHLWIKIFNNSDQEVDLTSWSVADYDGTSWHYHAINTDTSSTLGPSSSAIVAKASATTIDDFKNKNPDITDVLFYGNLTIEDEGTLGLSNDKKTIVSQKSYGGSNNVITDSTAGNNDSSSSTSSQSSSSGSSSKNEEQKVYKIVTKIITPKIVTAGIPFIIDHQTTGTKNEKVILGKFVWNFGDGNYKEVLTSDSFEYAYQYGGDYVLTLSFYDSILKDKPDAVDRINIKVTAPGLVVSSVGKADDPFIEIENKSNYEMNLFNFIIKGGVHFFSIPDGTILLPGKKLKLSPKITGFDFSDLSYISIVNKEGQIFATYPNRIPSIIKYSTNQNSNSNIVKSESVTNSKLEDSPEVINLNDLGASASNFGAELVSSKGLYSWVGLIGIMFLGILSVIFIRNKRDYPDYVDKEISTKDMTIIE